MRALFVDGGNPVIALPGQRKTERAFRALDLLVVIDPFMTATARLAHYVLPPRMMLERHDLGSRDYEVHTMQRPYAQYAEPVLEPPEGAELVDDWHVFYEVSRRLGTALTLDGVPLDMARRPSTEDLLRILLREAAVPFDTLRAATRGQVFEVPSQAVEPAAPGANARFEVAPDDIVLELATVSGESSDPSGGGFRLAVRRLRDVQNTMFHRLDEVRRRLPANVACLHPEDMRSLTLADGQSVEIRSAHGAIRLPARADATVRRQVVSVTHGWGDLLDDPDDSVFPSSPGVNVNLLTSADVRLDPINAMPQLTGIPITVHPLEPAPPSE